MQQLEQDTKGVIGEGGIPSEMDEDFETERLGDDPMWRIWGTTLLCLISGGFTEDDPENLER